MKTKIDIYKNRKREEPMKIVDILKCLIIGFVLSCLVLTFVRISVVNGPSMNDTLSNGQRLIVSRMSYVVNNPKRGDIVIAESDKLDVKYIIKRVIGVPGDTIELKHNKFYINGKKINEPYIKETMENNENQKWTLGKDEYFICGDNRNNSLDSRVIGSVNKSQIFGKVVFDLQHFKIVK